MRRWPAAAARRGMYAIFEWLTVAPLIISSKAGSAGFVSYGRRHFAPPISDKIVLLAVSLFSRLHGDHESLNDLP